MEILVLLIDHVGTGRHYNINSKHGHLSLVPVYTDGGTSRFTTDISCYAENNSCSYGKQKMIML